MEKYSIFHSFPSSRISIEGKIIAAGLTYLITEFDNIFPCFPDNAPERQIQVRYDVMEVPITLPSQKPAADKPNPKQGIGKADSDANTEYIFES